jgi:hypothetical protein
MRLIESTSWRLHHQQQANTQLEEAEHEKAEAGLRGLVDALVELCTHCEQAAGLGCVTALSLGNVGVDNGDASRVGDESEGVGGQRPAGRHSMGLRDAHKALRRLSVVIQQQQQQQQSTKIDAINSGRPPAEAHLATPPAIVDAVAAPTPASLGIVGAAVLARQPALKRRRTGSPTAADLSCENPDALSLRQQQLQQDQHLQQQQQQLKQQQLQQDGKVKEDKAGDKPGPLLPPPFRLIPSFACSSTHPASHQSDGLLTCPGRPPCDFLSGDQGNGDKAHLPEVWSFLFPKTNINSCFYLSPRI